MARRIQTRSCGERFVYEIEHSIPCLNIETLRCLKYDKLRHIIPRDTSLLLR